MEKRRAEKSVKRAQVSGVLLLCAWQRQTKQTLPCSQGSNRQTSVSCCEAEWVADLEVEDQAEELQQCPSGTTEEVGEYVGACSLVGL